MSVKAPHDCHPRDFDAKAFLTPLGSFLRESSIDELLQIFNILKGDMCFIGPRPVQLTEKELITHRATIGIYQLYPGISGLDQVSGRNTVNDAAKLLFDYEYLEKFSPLLEVGHSLSFSESKLRRTTRKPGRKRDKGWPLRC